MLSCSALSPDPGVRRQGPEGQHTQTGPAEPAEPNHEMLGGPQHGFVQEYVRRLLSQLSPPQEVEFASALRRLATAFSGRFINSVSGHCGCGFDIKMAKPVVIVLNERYGLDLAWRARVQVESDPDKQNFLMREHPDVELLVPDMVYLAQTEAPNVKDKSTSAMVPEFEFMSSGFPCVSRTPQSSQRKDNVNCVQEERSATGLGFKMVYDVSVAH